MGPKPNLINLLMIITTISSTSMLRAQSITGSDTTHDTTTTEVAGCGCAPQPPPQPSDFPNLKQFYAYSVIQRFKLTITCDPMNITASWTGYKLCDDTHTLYKGFYCANPPNSPTTPTIASIDFNGYHLCAPTIAGFIDQLPDLALFHANSNNFSGTVPDLTGLQYLYELDLSNNVHVGPFPENVLPLVNLTFLDIRFNSFFGTVPSSSMLLGAEAFFLNNNMFHGSIPDNLGSSPAEYLAFANNQFTGPIPLSIGNEHALSEVLFLGNQLSGCLPYEIGLLENLTVFDAGTNELTGPLPLSLGCLDQVEQLNLAGNQLYGHLPDEICLLAVKGKLENLSMSENYFVSIGFTCFRLVKKKVLDVRHNCLAGFPDQRSYAECAWFYSLPKHCPFIPHMPCHNPGWPSNKTMADHALPQNTGVPAMSSEFVDHTAAAAAAHSKGNGN